MHAPVEEGKVDHLYDKAGIFQGDSRPRLKVVFYTCHLPVHQLIHRVSHYNLKMSMVKRICLVIDFLLFINIVHATGGPVTGRDRSSPSFLF
jgi:hypothetical protein